jgi:hypothetical protein
MSALSPTMSANPRTPYGPETLLIGYESHVALQNDAVLRLLEEEFGLGSISWTLPPDGGSAPERAVVSEVRPSFWRRLFRRGDWRGSARSASARGGGLEQLGAECPSAKQAP